MAKSPFLVFFSAVMISAWWGGIEAGLLATILSAFVSAYFFLPPLYSLALNFSDVVRVGLFVIQGILFSLLCQNLHRTSRQLSVNLQSLQTREAQYRRLVETATEGIWTLDAQGQTNYVNQRMAEMLGYSSQHLLGRSSLEFIDPSDRDRFRQQLEHIQQGSLEQYELRFRRSDGSTLWTLVSIKPTLGDRGEFLGMLGMVTDVTARKQTEEALQAALQQLTFHVENSPLAVVEWDHDYRVTRWSPQAEIIFGWKAEEVIGKQPGDWQLVHPDDLEAVQQVIAQLVNGTEHRNMVRNRNYTKQGSIIYCEWYNSTSFDEEGNFVSVLCLVLDVTARIEAEQALRASEAQFRLVTDTVPSLIAYVDAEQRYRFCNQTYQDWFGSPPSTVIGQTIEAVLGDAAYQQIRGYVEAALAGQQVSFESELAYQDGGVRFIDATYIPDCDEQGNVEGFVGLVSDITRRKQAEAALQAANDRVTRILESISDAFVAFDRQWYFTYVNEEAARLLQKSGEELIGKQLWQEAYPEAVGTQFYQEAHRAIAEQISITFEDFSQILNRWLEVSIYPSTEGLSVYFRDITERVRVEDERKQTAAIREQLLAAEQAARAEAETANRMKDEFLATLSHELRSPLNAMLGWTNLLRSRQFDEATVARALETIERNARAQAQLIEDLLDVSRIIRGQLRLDVQSLKLIPIIEAAIETVRPAAEAKNIRLQPVLDPAAGPISGDANRLQQIIWNLLSNAIKFTPKGGRVQIRLERINSHIEIIVSDSGQGIAPQFLPYVFDRFRQADSSISRSYNGLGLGLAIVRHLVELHGGTVRAESLGEGQGATFIVKLPLMAVTATINDPERVHPTVGRGLAFDPSLRLDELHILVVDDEADARDLITNILQSCGATVIAVATADAAIAALRDQPADAQIDVLVSDIGMPEQDGYALLRQVRLLEASQRESLSLPQGRLPAVALTAYARAEDRRATILAGFQAHIAKPVEPAEFIAVIASLAERLGR